MLAETAYGKSSVRLVKVSRHGDRHDLKDLTVSIRFEGEYDQSYTDGDNREVLLANGEKVPYDRPQPTPLASRRHSAVCSRSTSSSAIRGCGECAST